MIRVIIVRPRAEHQIRLVLPDQPDDLLPNVQRRHQFSVVDVEHVDVGSQDLGSLLDFLLAAQRQRPAGLAPVADVAIGHRDELDVVPLSSPHRPDAPGLQFAVVGMGAKADDAQLAIVRRRLLRPGRDGECQTSQNRRKEV
jgi:hypothetical protein